jgi:hypothetical protein
MDDFLSGSYLCPCGTQSFGQVPRTPAVPSGLLGGSGDKDTQSEHRVWNLRYCGPNDREGRSLSPERPGLNVFGRNMCDAQFPKCF